MAQSETIQKKIYSIKEASLVLGRSKSTIHNWIRDGHISAIKIGKKNGIRKETIDKILADGLDIGDKPINWGD